MGSLLASVPRDRLSLVEADLHEAAVEAIRDRLGERRLEGMPLTSFLRSPAMLIDGNEIPRQDVISYVANKLGGAHYDPKRDRSEAGRRMRLLDRDVVTFEPTHGPKAPVFYAELLSIAEFLRDSSDATRFRDEFRRWETAMARSDEGARC